MSDSFLYWMPFVVIGGWSAIGVFLSFLGGWHALARAYRATEPIRGKRFWMKSASMRFGVAYQGCINFGVDVHGLFVSIVPIFRLGCPPLFIPWSDIHVTSQRGWLLGGIQLKFRKRLDVPILLPTKVATQVFENAPIKLPAV